MAIAQLALDSPRLFFNDQELKDEDLVSKYPIKSMDTLHV